MIKSSKHKEKEVEEIEKLLAEATNMCAVQILKHSKKHISQTIESMNLEKETEDILKSLVKNQLHYCYEGVVQDISKLANNREEYFNHLFQLEIASKSK